MPFSIEPNSYSFLSCFIIHLARNAEKGELMSIILPNLNHSFICPVPVSVPDSGFRIPDSVSGFLIPFPDS